MQLCSRALTSLILLSPLGALPVRALSPMPSKALQRTKHTVALSNAKQWHPEGVPPKRTRALNLGEHPPGPPKNQLASLATPDADCICRRTLRKDVMLACKHDVVLGECIMQASQPARVRRLFRLCLHSASTVHAHCKCCCLQCTCRVQLLALCKQLQLGLGCFFIGTSMKGFVAPQGYLALCAAHPGHSH